MPQSSTPQSSLDSLRTVEFRQTLRGYHIDDVDEYLERVAVEAEALQEQHRMAGERLKQAAERIQVLEQQLEEQGPRRSGDPAPVVDAPNDDALQRTLLLAQKFVDQTQAEAEAQAKAVVDEAEGRARNVVTEAEDRARAIVDDAERQLRDDVTRLESLRTKLAVDVEDLSRHIAEERARLRVALTDMVSWIDDQVQSKRPVDGFGERFEAGGQSGAEPSTEPRTEVMSVFAGEGPSDRHF